MATRPLPSEYLETKCADRLLFISDFQYTVKAWTYKCSCENVSLMAGRKQPLRPLQKKGILQWP